VNDARKRNTETAAKKDRMKIFYETNGAPMQQDAEI
jgi:hypothetical protein